MKKIFYILVAMFALLTTSLTASADNKKTMEINFLDDTYKDSISIAFSNNTYLCYKTSNGKTIRFTYSKNITCGVATSADYGYNRGIQYASNKFAHFIGYNGKTSSGSDDGFVQVFTITPKDKDMIVDEIQFKYASKYMYDDEFPNAKWLRDDDNSIKNDTLITIYPISVYTQYNNPNSVSGNMTDADSGDSLFIVNKGVKGNTYAFTLHVNENSNWYKENHDYYKDCDSYGNWKEGIMENIYFFFEIYNIKITYHYEDGTSGITTTNVDARTEDKIYSLDGKQMQSIPTHGIYIKNGKKYVR